MGTLHVIVPFCPMSEVESLLELAVQTRDSESTTCESTSGQHTQREIYSVNYTFDLENEMSKKDDFKVKICNHVCFSEQISNTLTSPTVK